MIASECSEQVVAAVGASGHIDKTVEDYLALPYTIEMIPGMEGGWVVSVRELPGCLSQGDDPDDAITMIRDAMRCWLEVALEDGLPIPEPRELEQYSGKFVVRVPRWLHRALVRTTDEEGVSLNQFVSTALARAIGEQAAAPARPTARPLAGAETRARLEAVRLVLDSLTASLKRGDTTGALRLAGEMGPLLQTDPSGPNFPEGRPQTAHARAKAGRKRRADPVLVPGNASYVIPHQAGVVCLADKDAGEPATADSKPG